MKILIANDDGIFSPGIMVLAEEATAFGDVLIVAPDNEQSSMGMAITSTRPLSYRKTRIAGFNAYRVNGTPSDCVALGIHHLADVNVVLSGINLGYNLGNAMWHSGTLAAAKQAALFGYRGIAFSAQPIERVEDYGPLRPYIRKVLEMLLTTASPALLTNVNFPPKPHDVVWTRQSVRHYDGKVFPAKDPMGREHFWFTAVPIEAVDAGTDRWAISQNLVSLTPLCLDLTDHKALAREQARTEKPVASV